MPAPAGQSEASIIYSSSGTPAASQTAGEPKRMSPYVSTQQGSAEARATVAEPAASRRVVEPALPQSGNL